MRIDLMSWTSVIASLVFLVYEQGRPINTELFFFHLRFLSGTHLRSISFFFSLWRRFPTSEGSLSVRQQIYSESHLYPAFNSLHLALLAQVTLQLSGPNSHGLQPHRTFTADAVIPVFFLKKKKFFSRAKGEEKEAVCRSSVSFRWPGRSRRPRHVIDPLLPELGGVLYSTCLHSVPLTDIHTHASQVSPKTNPNTVNTHKVNPQAGHLPDDRCQRSISRVSSAA